MTVVDETWVHRYTLSPLDISLNGCCLVKVIQSGRNPQQLADNDLDSTFWDSFTYFHQLPRT